MLLDGHARARPRSPASIYVYSAAVQPLIEQWSADRGHLREVTAADIKAVLDPLRGHQLRTTTTAVRSLFRFAKKRGLVFANPAARLKASDPGGSLLPMTDAEIQAVEQAATSPAQRLIVALAVVHAARWVAIRDLTLDDLDLPDRRITIAGHRQRLGELTYRALRAWLDDRRATWPRTPNRHVLISGKTALATGTVTRSYLNWNLQRHGVSIERIRRDRVLHEALTARRTRCTWPWSSACPTPPPASTLSSPAISSAASPPGLPGQRPCRTAAGAGAHADDPVHGTTHEQPVMIPGTGRSVFLVVAGQGRLGRIREGSCQVRGNV